MTASPRIALIAVTRTGIERGRQLRERLQAGTLYRPASEERPPYRWESPYDGALSSHMSRLFADHDQLFFFLATGAVTRLIAPHIADKATDPGVLAIDEATRFVIALLSGHQGGANAWARTVAGMLGATPVITTASDVVGGLSLDLLEDQLGWVAESPDQFKTLSAAIVNRQPVTIVQEIGASGSWLNEWDLPDHVSTTHDVTQLPSPAAHHLVWITDRIVTEVPDALAEASILWFRPKSLVLGIGCERDITLQGLEDGLDTFLQDHHIAKASIAAIASLDVKADEAAIVELAGKYGWETAFYAADDLANVPGIARPSAVVEACVGTPGVSEPAALRLAGTDQLLVEKQVVTSPLSSKRMTFALARDNAFQDRTTKRGRVTFIGAGPGDPDLLTIKAKREIRRADVVIYAGSLIPEAILQDTAPDATLHNSAPMTLEDTMRLMLHGVQAGKRVVRLQSGDLSLYSAIQEQMSQLDEAGITYGVIPGVSAFQAAAAALQSELTIPETVQTIILTRGEGKTPMPSGESLAALAAHKASLCIFLSARISRKVQDQLLSAYTPETPVAIMYRVSWPDEKIIVTELQQLHATIRENKLTRTTLILVGEAIGARKHRSHLYNTTHAHIFRRRRREPNRSSA